MTTIAYRAGVLAGDSRETAIADGESAMTVNDSSRKVFRLPDGRLFGASRSSEAIQRLYHALVNNHPAPKLEDVNGLLVDRKGRIWLYEGTIVHAKYFAVGSGGGFATAAMDAGASAIAAVKIGVKRDPFSGGKVTSVRLHK